MPSSTPTVPQGHTVGNDSAELISNVILRFLLPHRRSEAGEHEHTDCFAEQLAAIRHFVDRQEPILFTLPAFPCKSPNRRKVLGHLPDMGELLSLQFLNQLCDQVAKVHTPGARMLLCSDGHVFGDLIRVPDDHITEYGDEIQAMVERHGLSHIEAFSLQDVYPGHDYDGKRKLLTEQYAQSLESLREEVRSDDKTLSLYRGITRFLVEDVSEWHDSKAALQRDCRQRAYGVIQRSRAWGDLIADHYPVSVRLSIHPQPCGAAKFGIRLLEIRDMWLTPWHSVAVLRTDGRFALMPRAEAEKIGKLVHQDGRPSHFVVDSSE
ncbi:L-tyrosine/L-tryptophan isonitrile synthase family protein [Micromonospora sagamiensis]|uniref:Pyoverdine/dityrosine biosynthesis protein Dit1 n=1 Tax=Micromonospora sagamiensis TaxID=47875 RepID=A0A562WC63_9ACTN|nr:isocyanide synthase family protein [Micromonospora sagamiensis]TWJ27860.1 pyoverdine/dityrosine biosynthesis protein Dit1 [Micromonospora sagamiensis]BCL13250.1 paerucumarin biosynthesis protein PvcA [Micromonospora sagamiensis]